MNKWQKKISNKILKYCEKDQEVLIDADKIEILGKNNKWISAGTFGIEQISIIFS